MANQKASNLLRQLLAVMSIELIKGVLVNEEDLLVGREAVACHHPDTEEPHLVVCSLNEGGQVLDTSVVNTVDTSAANSGSGSHWIVEEFGDEFLSE